MLPQKKIEREDALSIIWAAREQGELSEEALRRQITEEVWPGAIDTLLKEGMIAVAEGKVSLTAQGDEEGRDVIRRQRLAERLLADVLEVRGDAMDMTACEFEHILSKDVADAICTLLGHPRECPHGSRIPPGECCRRAEESIESIVVPLPRLAVGESGVIAYIVTGNHPQLHKLLSLGVVPGTTVHLHQRSPSHVIQVNQTQIALDDKVAEKIFVRKTG